MPSPGFIVYVVLGNVVALLSDVIGVTMPSEERVTPAGSAAFGNPGDIRGPREPSWRYPLQEFHFDLGYPTPVRVWCPAGMPRPPDAWVKATILALSPRRD